MEKEVVIITQTTNQTSTLKVDKLSWIHLNLSSYHLFISCLILSSRFLFLRFFQSLINYLKQIFHLHIFSLHVALITFLNWVVRSQRTQIHLTHPSRLNQFENRSRTLWNMTRNKIHYYFQDKSHLKKVSPR